jgi:hypothetical protein
MGDLQETIKECTWVDYVRKPKIFGMPLFDWIASLLVAVLFGVYVFHIQGYVMWVVFIIAWTGVGVLVHYMFGVDTMLGYYLGLNPVPKRNMC